MTWFHCGVFAGGTFTVILVANHHTADPGGFVRARRCGYGTIFLVELVLYGIGLFIEEINRSNEHIVADIIEMTPEFQPGTGH
ncbi:hypothetical protein D3C83_172540 [compost metagenome]